MCNPEEIDSCPFGGMCVLNSDGKADCLCEDTCSLNINPVCGSDAKSYDNECFLRLNSCRKRAPINVLHAGECGKLIQWHFLRHKNSVNDGSNMIWALFIINLNWFWKTRIATLYTQMWPGLFWFQESASAVLLKTGKRVVQKLILKSIIAFCTLAGSAPLQLKWFNICWLKVENLQKKLHFDFIFKITFMNYLKSNVKKIIVRGHSDLNQGPIDLQSIALPLSYTPYVSIVACLKCWVFYILP